jgi:hypothetical protein
MKNRLGVIIGGLLLIVAGGLLAVFWGRLPQELPWLYSLPEGEAQLLDKRFFALGLVLLAWVFALDVWLSHIFSRRDAILGRIILWAGVVVVVLYLASFFRVITLMI